MSRTKLVVAMAGLAVMAGAAGWACGVLSAPASGRELRRRLAWRTEEELRAASTAARAFTGRMVDRARAELARRRAPLDESARG